MGYLSEQLVYLQKLLDAEREVNYKLREAGKNASDSIANLQAEIRYFTGKIATLTHGNEILRDINEKLRAANDALGKENLELRSQLANEYKSAAVKFVLIWEGTNGTNGSIEFEDMHTAFNWAYNNTTKKNLKNISILSGS